MTSKIASLFVFVFIASLSFSQSIPWVEDFESGSGGYVSSISECTNNSFDYFTVTNGSDIAGIYSGSTGNYFAAMDIDAATCPGGATGAAQTLTWSGIDISGCTTMNFSIDVAEDDDGSNQDWDAGDYVHIDYLVDGGAWLPLIWFEAFDLTGAETNNYPALDNDFNTIGEGTEVTETFQTFSNVIGSFGNSLDLQITIRLDAGDEDIALDNLQLTGSCNTYSCIWSENFSTQVDGTQNDPGGRWTTTAGNCDADGTPGTVDDNYWGTEGGEFRVNDIEGLTCPCALGGDNDNIFITENIDISSYTQISISITLRAYDEGGGGFECDGLCNSEDRLTAQYELDGGGWVDFASMYGVDANYSSLECIDVPNGNNLQIRVLVGNQSNDENYYFDNINVCEAICSVVLPIELKQFTGEYNKLTSQNDLAWVTNSERNNSFFIVEKLIESEWQEIGRVHGSVTTSEEREYTFSDINPSNGMNYYRLSQVDIDGQKSTYNTLAIQSNLEGFKLYPNPTSQNVNLSLDMSLIGEKLCVVDNFGRIVHDQKVSSNSFELDLKTIGLNSGVYLLKIGSHNKRLVIK
jgi:hypothetical protein